MELAMRAELLRGLQEWLKRSGLSQAAAASQLGLTQARVSEISRGKISRFSLDKLVRLAARSGLRPALSLAACTNTGNRPRNHQPQDRPSRPERRAGALQMKWDSGSC